MATAVRHFLPVHYISISLLLFITQFPALKIGNGQVFIPFKFKLKAKHIVAEWMVVSEIWTYILFLLKAEEEKLFSICLSILHGTTYLGAPCTRACTKWGDFFRKLVGKRHVNLGGGLYVFLLVVFKMCFNFVVFLFVLICVSGVCKQSCNATACVEVRGLPRGAIRCDCLFGSLVSLVLFVFSLHHADSKAFTQVIRLCQKLPWPPEHKHRF